MLKKTVGLACHVTRGLCFRPNDAEVEGKTNLPLYRRTEKCIFQKSDGTETSFSAFFNNCELRRKGHPAQEVWLSVEKGVNFCGLSVVGFVVSAPPPPPSQLKSCVSAVTHVINHKRPTCEAARQSKL